MPRYTEDQMRKQKAARAEAKRELERRLKKLTRYRRAVVRQKRRYANAKARLAMMRKANREAANTGRLSEHFNVREFHCKDGTPVPRAAIPALRKLCVNDLEPQRARYGPASVHSGYRTRRHNSSVGGASLSEHIYDDDPTDVAADLSFAKGRPSQWASSARSNGTKGVGEYTTFTHHDNRHGAVARWYGP